MKYRYPCIFFENMWKYVTRRFRDTLERGANDFGRCSSTVVNNGAVNFDEKNEGQPGPPCNWLSLRKTKSHQNDSGSNGPKWKYEHRDKNWMGAITWENGFNKLHKSNEKNASPPCKWLFHKGSEMQKSENVANDMYWSFDQQDETWMNAKLKGHGMKKRYDNTGRKAGLPCKLRSFRRSKSLENDNGTNDSKWIQQQHRAWTEAKLSDNCVNKYNDVKNDKRVSLWITLRQYCKSYHNNDDTNGKKWSFQHLNRTWMDAITWSGVAVLGWYTSQLIHFKLKQHCRHHDNKCLPVNNLLTSIYPYITDMNKSDFYIDSISKIGKVLTDFTPTVYLMANEQSESLKIKANVTENLSSNVTQHKSSNVSEHMSGDKSGNSAQTHSHSPPNEQSIEVSGDDDLGGVLNSIENRLGLASIENGQYQDGLSLLRSAAERNHAPAIYNLGLCYEKGLGVTANENTVSGVSGIVRHNRLIVASKAARVSQSFRLSHQLVQSYYKEKKRNSSFTLALDKAMELYKSAAALDHPEALYNLGIFYGQGRGGLKADQETAVRLLRLAAVQGQQDAIDALKYLDVSISEPRQKDINSWTYKEHTQFPASQNIVPTQSKLFIDNINFLQARV